LPTIAFNSLETPKEIEMATSLEASIRRTIRRHQLREMVPLADSTIYEMEQRGEFPRRFALSPRCVVWDLSEVEAWLALRRSAPITRVLLNLFGNGFYAANKRRRDAAGPDFKPALKVTTEDLGEAVEIRVRDNGAGIAPEIKDKLFQPFFTTKPTGEGTGLGLSISWDIVTQQHGGTISVDSRVGEFTEFAISLPRARHAITAVTAEAAG
jgi:signal transduction histidine kinase